MRHQLVAHEVIQLKVDSRKFVPFIAVFELSKHIQKALDNNKDNRIKAHWSVSQKNMHDNHCIKQNMVSKAGIQ